MTERQEALYKYLQQHATNDFVSKENICKALKELYPRHLEITIEHNSRAFAAVREDVKFINRYEGVDMIVISSARGYKVATNETEAIEYISRMYHSAINKLARVSAMQRKLGRNNQLRANKEELEIIKTFEVCD